jgi:arylsulfatase A-like enzyme
MAPRVVPPKAAPNVLLIMTDDAGFGEPRTFGGVIPAPAPDRIARAGPRYTDFHSTSLCSPTWAALITGRNHYVAGFGVVARNCRRLQRLRLDHSETERNHRQHFEGE